MSKKLSPFDFLNSINQKGPDLLEGVTAQEQIVNPDSPERQYNAFIINRGLSHFADTVMAANEMNRFAFLPARMQYDFLKGIIRKRRRFSKWAKKLPAEDKIKVIMEYYKYSRPRAEEVHDFFDDDDIKTMKKALDKGGKK